MSDGYPTEAELDAIETFYGTPLEFVEYIGSIWRNGAGWSLEPLEDNWREGWLARFVTGGWSGCEDVMGRVAGVTMFSFLFHSKWERGGLWEFEIGKGLADVKMNLGKIE